jgi:hypothetical protein
MAAPAAGVHRSLRTPRPSVVKLSCRLGCHGFILIWLTFIAANAIKIFDLEQLLLSV